MSFYRAAARFGAAMSAQSPKIRVDGGRYLLRKRRVVSAQWAVVRSFVHRWVVRAPQLPNRPPDRQKLLPPLLAHGVGIESLELLERMGDRLAGRCNGDDRVAVGAADRLGHDLVDDAE